jgi:hypothetical protein
MGSRQADGVSDDAIAERFRSVERRRIFKSRVCKPRRMEAETTAR